MGRDRRQREDGATGPPLRDRRASACLGPFAGQPPRAEAAFPERQQKNIGRMNRPDLGGKTAPYSSLVGTLLGAATAPAPAQSSGETARDFRSQDVCIDALGAVLEGV